MKKIQAGSPIHYPEDRLMRWLMRAMVVGFAVAIAGVLFVCGVQFEKHETRKDLINHEEHEGARR